MKFASVVALLFLIVGCGGAHKPAAVSSQAEPDRPLAYPGAPDGPLAVKLPQFGFALQLPSTAWQALPNPNPSPPPSQPKLILINGSNGAAVAVMTFASAPPAAEVALKLRESMSQGPEKWSAIEAWPGPPSASFYRDGDVKGKAMRFRVTVIRVNSEGLTAVLIFASPQAVRDQAEADLAKIVKSVRAL